MSPSTPQLKSIDLPESPLEISFPRESGGFDQDEEWFVVEDAEGRRRLRMHDYAALYDTPGLYEALVYRALKCSSPERVVLPLEKCLQERSESMADLRVMDLGAGNGIVGALLRERGTEHVAGIDIIPEAAEAARRDRPGTYDEYIVTDLSKSDATTEKRLREFAPNCLVTVAALGYGDIPPEAFVKAFNLLPTHGWLGMCIKDRFLEVTDENGFGRLVRSMIDDGTIEVLHRERYVHRLSIAGEKLHYVALVARKKRDARLIQ